MLAILALYLSANIYHNYKEGKNEEPVRIIEKSEEVKQSAAGYIITEEMILGKLTEELEEVSLKGKLDDNENKYIKVEDNWLGERHTQLNYSGTYKMGLDKNNIEVKHIDQSTGTVYLKLPKPILISLTLPYDQIDFEKTKGFLRLAMNEDEKKQYYKSVEKDIKHQLMNNKELIRQVDLLNKAHTMETLKELSGMKNVIFE